MTPRKKIRENNEENKREDLVFFAPDLETKALIVWGVITLRSKLLFYWSTKRGFSKISSPKRLLLK